MTIISLYKELLQLKYKHKTNTFIYLNFLLSNYTEVYIQEIKYIVTMDNQCLHLQQKVYQLIYLYCGSAYLLDTSPYPVSALYQIVRGYQAISQLPHYITITIIPCFRNVNHILPLINI